jgi:putative mRNA 3-end processing factor
MECQFLGGADEIGRSALLVDDRLLLDYGMAAGDPPQYPIDPADGLAPDAVVVTHGHLDHAGAVPGLLSGGSRPDIHWTPTTRDLTRVLARDTLKLHGSTPLCPFTELDVQRIGEVSTTHGYREGFEVCGGPGCDGYQVTLFDAGHIPGSAHVLVDDGDTRLLYTGDFHTDDQRLVSGTTARPAADVVVCESTYAETVHEDRATVEARFVEAVRTTRWEGGTVVVPAFAIGRTQELLLVCVAHDIDCYVDGMGQQVTDLVRRSPDFLRDAEALRRAKSNARFVDGRDGQRERIAAENTVIITTSGMLSGGPAMTYVPAVREHPKNLVALTGYQVDGTPGRALLDTGSAELDGRVMPVSAQVEVFDFSAHADRDGLLSFLDSYRDARVVTNHGDDPGGFAADLRERGFEARGAELGECVRL